jgi:CelD/BcsL family acetyltransferase involved in cellulose biosynthesis
VVDVIEDTEKFALLQYEWSELLDSSGANQLFLSWHWLYTWWRHLSEGRRLHLITVRRRGKLLAIAPLVIRPPKPQRLLPFRALEFLGTGAVGSDYLDLIIRRGEEQESIRALAEYLHGCKYMLDLARADAVSAHIRKLGVTLARYGWHAERSATDVCPYIALRGHTWESYLASLSSAHRYNLRRRIRNAERNFRLKFVAAESDTTRREYFSEFLGLHNKRWETRSGSEAMHTTHLVRFHEEFSVVAQQLGWLRLYLLQFDGRPVAAIYGFNCAHTTYLYQTGFDPTYSKYSVGLICIGLAIERAVEQGVYEFDFLHGDEGYKYQWAHRQRKLLGFNLYPPNAHGKVYREVMQLRESMKKFLRTPQRT